ARNFNKENNNILTTYFFTDFPDSFGAKAMFNAFHHYGDVMEVVIPTKRDKGGNRFGGGHNVHHHVKTVEENTYARAVRSWGTMSKGGSLKRVVTSYEAEKDDMSRLEKVFIGVVVNPGMTYNIQNYFHTQGYFGVKVTPLGSNLVLLEGHAEGEVQALLDDAKDWLYQLFTEIRPWNPNNVDVNRVSWLRIFGIPLHAWNDLFFTQVTKPWGTFMNTDD
ncbi:hypothetical protein TSUD_423290, partial [Trifolium subterraneum]